MGPGKVRRQVDAGNDVGVVQLGAHPVTPRIGGVEAVAVALLLRVGGGRANGGVLVAGEGTRAKHRAAAEADIGAIGIAQAVDAVVADLADQGQAAGPPDLVDEVGGGDLRLHHRHAFVAGQVAAQCLGGFTAGEHW
ncbi:hypothetical protein D3C79_823530 [compost metagenome]